ncbi:helix-turn-helix transcriptional regulator [Altererythrobacter sp. GH1-8]|uniref:helix-turn-helix transcriptional regulator n=1 Tax=Altererythrobacter sp. GH1-8 TaxID=3349333 RepID=UPI00374DD569
MAYPISQNWCKKNVMNAPFNKNAASGLLGNLTKAQRDVLDRVLLHRTSKEIARELNISPNTVDQRVKAARQKLGTADRAETARLYAQLKLICGQTTYDTPVIDLETTDKQEGLRELSSGDVFTLRDAQIGRDFYWEHPADPLEALDAKFGRWGRVGAILVCALAIVLIVLVVTAISVTIGNLV